MAKIQDKLYNRVIEGELLELSDEEIKKLGLAKESDIPASFYIYDIDVTNSQGETLVIGNYLAPLISEIPAGTTQQDVEQVVRQVINLFNTYYGMVEDKGALKMLKNGQTSYFNDQTSSWTVRITDLKGNVIYFSEA